MCFAMFFKILNWDRNNPCEQLSGLLLNDFFGKIKEDGNQSNHEP